MGRFSKLDVECAVPLAVRDDLQPQEVDAILEIVFLAAAADGQLADEEADAFIRIMLRLFGQHATPERIRGVMQQIAARVQRGESCRAARCARVGELAPALQRPVARELAYKLCYVMLMSDLETNEDEFAFDLELRRLLGIPSERAEALADEASQAVVGGPSRKGRGAPTCAGAPPSQMDLPFGNVPATGGPGAPASADPGAPASAGPTPRETPKKKARTAATKKPVRKPAAKAVRRPARKAAGASGKKPSRKPAKKPARKPVRKVARKPAPKRSARKKPAGKKPAKRRSRR